MSKTIFVFGSNLAGVHGAGAARHALQTKGAIWGRGHGCYGNSYALPTKDKHIKSLPFGEVMRFIRAFIEFAELCPENTFQVTRVGCGLAGFRDSEIAPLFAQAPKNCQFDETWREYLGDDFIYWGTF